MTELRVVVYHGGTLVRNPNTRYIGAKVFEKKLDPDLVTYWWIIDWLREVGYEENKLKKIYYRIPGKSLDVGLRELHNDTSALDMAGCGLLVGHVDVYVEHVGEVDHIGYKNSLTKSSVNKEVLVDHVDEKLGKGKESGEENDSGENEDDSEDFSIEDGEELNVGFDEELGNIVDTILLGEEDELVEAVLKVKEHRQPSSLRTDEVVQEHQIAAGDRLSRRGSEPENELDNGDEVGNALDNSDVDSLSSESGADGERELVRRPSKYPKYDENAKEVKFFVGQCFTDVTQCRRALRKYEIFERREFVYTKNEKSRIRARCKEKDCRWLFFASIEKMKSKVYFMVKTYVGRHNCSKRYKVSKANSPWIANTYESLISGHRNLKPGYIADQVREHFHLEVSKNQCKRAKRNVLNKFERDVREEYARLHNYAKALLASNPGSNVDIEVDHRGPGCPPFFKCFYVCFATIRYAFLKGCRRFIGLDGCFLKGSVKGQLLTAVGKDSNNQMFPLAWAVVEVECLASWQWFLEHLRFDIQTVGGGGWCFMSDQQKGLIHAVEAIFPRAEHRFCARHVYANWYPQFRGEALKLAFYAVAKTPNEQTLKKRLDELEMLKPGAKEAVMRVDPRKWCRAYFSIATKCESVDNNSCEAFNFVLLEARRKPIISMLEEMRIFVMQRSIEKRNWAAKWPHGEDYGKKIREVLDENITNSYKWRVQWNGQDGYEISLGRSRYEVQLQNKFCTCKSWELFGIPCAHAIRAIHFKDEDPKSYINPWYKKANFLKAYSYVIGTMPGKEFWENSGLGIVLPPLERPMPGLLQTKRKKGRNEPKKGKLKMSRHGRQMHCSICKGEGHTRRTCGIQQRTNKAGEVGVGVFNDPVSGSQILNPGLRDETILNTNIDFGYNS